MIFLTLEGCEICASCSSHLVWDKSCITSVTRPIIVVDKVVNDVGGVCVVASGLVSIGANSVVDKLGAFFILKEITPHLKHIS